MVEPAYPNLTVIIERMSEDIDLKVQLKDQHNLSNSALRTQLSKLKSDIADTLSELGFQEISENRKARNANRYFSSRWQYQSQYGGSASLRPHLNLELVFRKPQYGNVSCSIHYLFEQFIPADRDLLHIDCVTLEETLSEKVISFLRRYAHHRAGVMRQDWDSALVRHIYDVYCIVRHDQEVVIRAERHFNALIEFDVGEFGRQYPPFAHNAKNVMLSALEKAATDSSIQREYKSKLIPLVFGKVKPNFDEAYSIFRQSALKLIKML